VQYNEDIAASRLMLNPRIPKPAFNPLMMPPTRTTMILLLRNAVIWWRRNQRQTTGDKGELTNSIPPFYPGDYMTYILISELIDHSFQLAFNFHAATLLE